MVREAHAIWKGGPYAGEGVVSTPVSGILSNATYAFGSLAGVAPFTTPGELLAAAIASSMATTVARQMAKLAVRPVTVDTYAVLAFEASADGYRLTSAQLTITALALEGDSKRFEQAIEIARHECPIAGALKIDLVCKPKLSLVSAAALV